MHVGGFHNPFHGKKKQITSERSTSDGLADSDWHLTTNLVDVFLQHGTKVAMLCGDARQESWPEGTAPDPISLHSVA